MGNFSTKMIDPAIPNIKNPKLKKIGVGFFKIPIIGAEELNALATTFTSPKTVVL